MKKRKYFSELIRSATFGVQDSLVSTVGLISGVAAGGEDKKTIIMTGFVLIVVEALSMGMGEITAIESEEEAINHKEFNIKKTIPSAIVMFISYILAGMVPLLPYIFWSKEAAFPTSILMSFAGLYAYGYIYGKRLKLSANLHGMRMLILGGSAIVVGVLVGWFLR